VTTKRIAFSNVTLQEKNQSQRSCRPIAIFIKWTFMACMHYMLLYYYALIYPIFEKPWRQNWQTLLLLVICLSIRFECRSRVLGPSTFCRCRP